MAKLICKNCGYRFEGEEEVKIKCPYCDKKEIEEEKDAEELIKDVEKILEH